MTTSANNHINLTDVSFLIPVRIDSPERYRNLLLIIKYLNLYTDTHILVLEADVCPKISSHLLQNKVKYHFVEDVAKKFHRTRYINELAAMADTPFICICDADALVPILQLEETVKLLRDGYSYVLPYDGSLIMTKEKEIELFIQKMNCNVFDKHILLEYVCGGAIFLNRKDFICAGMSNENITSWGPDDVEQKKRMEILGFSMTGVKGSLFHLSHPKGINSTYEDMNERVRLTEEYIKVASFGKVELQRYVDSWEWLYKYQKSIPSELLQELITNLTKINEVNANVCESNSKIIAIAFIYLYIYKYYDNVEYKDKAFTLLDEVCKAFNVELSNSKVMAAWLTCVMAKEYYIPEYSRKITDKVYAWIFHWLKVPGTIRLDGENGLIITAWWFYSLVMKYGIGIHDVVFYKEQLVFVTDRIYDLLRSEDMQNEASFARIMGQLILLIGRLRFSGVNQLKVASIEIKVEHLALRYLDKRVEFIQEDAWLLYAILERAKEIKNNEQYELVACQAKSYLNCCEYIVTDSRLCWIIERLAEECGEGKPNLRECDEDVFSICTRLNMPQTWLYTWLLI